MSSPHTFFGKVTTLLIGSALSWLTVTNAEFRATMDALIGDRPAAMVAEHGARLAKNDLGRVDELESPLNEKHHMNRDSVTTSSETAQSGLPGIDHIDEIAIQLRNLGATYLLLERLPNLSGDQYRVRCDLAGQASRVKCCFEATRESAEAAMHEVLQAVLNVDSHHSGLAESVVSSM